MGTVGGSRSALGTIWPAWTRCSYTSLWGGGGGGEVSTLMVGNYRVPNLRERGKHNVSEDQSMLSP